MATVKQPKPVKVKCVECGKKAADGVVDMYARFWCEDCLIFLLGTQTPASVRKSRRNPRPW